MNKPQGVSVENLDPTHLEGFADMDIDPDSLSPEKHYRVIQDRPTRLARVPAQGYQPVNVESGVRRLSVRDTEKPEDSFDAEGLFRVGDGILCEVPKEIKQERDNKQERLKRARLSAPEGQFRKRAKAAGFDVNDKKEK